MVKYFLLVTTVPEKNVQCLIQLTVLCKSNANLICSFYGAAVTFSYFFYLREKFFGLHVLASPLGDVYIFPKQSEDLVEKIISPVIFDTNCSFKQ